MLGETVNAISVQLGSYAQFAPQIQRVAVSREVSNYCSSLVVLESRAEPRYGGVEEDVTELHLAHFTFQEYLMSDRLKSNLAHHF